MAAVHGPRLAADIYEKLTDEEDARVCRDIPESACRVVPGNFLRVLVSYCCTKLGDALASPKTVLAWLVTAVGAPGFVLGLLVPIRESGSLIPQLLIGAAIRRLPVRKWAWVAGSLVQALAIAGLGLAAMTLSGAAAGWAVIALVGAFSLARGVCSVAAKDVLGKTIPKTRRGQLNGWSAGAAGLISVVVALVVLTPDAGVSDPYRLGSLLIAGAALWVMAALVYSGIREVAGETGGGGNAVRVALGRLAILRDDATFRRFVVTRALLMCSALSAPFYVALAHGLSMDSGAAGASGRGIAALGLFVVADGLGNLVSGPVWGRLADRSSRQVMVRAALVAAASGITVFAVQLCWPALLGSVWFLPGAYFLLCVAHSGVRVGRKTYVVDLGSGNRRTDYVAVSNSTIGVLLLLAGSVGALVPLIGHAGVLGLLALLGLAGAALGRTLPEVQR
ncbi:MAG: MFS transporter [Pseudomonadales bacterium]